MNDLYIKNPDETKVNKREIENLVQEKYGNLAGLAITVSILLEKKPKCKNR